MLHFNPNFHTWKSALEKELEKNISTFLKRPSFARVSNKIKSRILEFALSGGKRLRPRLFLIANSAYKPLEKSTQLSAAAGIELFHLFALIHDDLIDGSPQRRGQPSLHELLRIKPGEAGVRDGRSLALITGDLIFTRACKTFADLQLSDALKNRALNLLLDVALTTGGGALTEVSLRDCPTHDSAITRKLHCHKTAEYSFSIPLVIGGLLGNCETSEEKKLFELGHILGKAYQIKDDLEDLEALLNGNDKSEEARRDVFQNLPFVIGLESNRNEEFTDCWNSYMKNPCSKNSKNVMQMLHDCNAFASARKEMQELFFSAEKQITDLDIETADKENIIVFLKKLF
ncbi:MAG: polyprenyl synthetase family protein [Candidatus Rifleibacteriota bacterium]